MHGKSCSAKAMQLNKQLLSLVLDALGKWIRVGPGGGEILVQQSFGEALEGRRKGSNRVGNQLSHKLAPAPNQRTSPGNIPLS